MQKTITLTRPNGLKFEVMVDEINDIKKCDYVSAVYLEDFNQIDVIETPDQINTLIAEAKRDDESINFDSDEVDLFRQWYNSMINTSPLYVEKKDYDLYIKIMNFLKLKISSSDIPDCINKPKTTNLTREEMLKAIDEGKLVKAYINGTLLLFSNASLGKDIRWEIVEEKEE